MNNEEKQQRAFIKNEELVAKLQDMKPHITYSLDDKGLGNLFADVFKDSCRYNTTSKEWFCYNGKIWKRDDEGLRVKRYAKKLTNALLVYAMTIEDETQSKQYFNFVLKLGKLSNRETMIRDSKDIHFITKEMLDKNLSLFNCQNGTLNLDSYEFYEHDPNDLLGKISNVIYAPKASSNLFDIFMRQIMQDNKGKIEYLKKILGYALTGETTLETCFVFWGPTTRNGKSTLLESFSYMLGNTEGYSLNMKAESLAAKQNADGRQASGDIARLDGCRCVTASEPPKKMVFDIPLLKVLLGRDTITARHLYEREFQFKPLFKLFINTNFLPQITDDTLFTSGRLNVIPFDRHFAPHEQNKTLKDTLTQPEHLSGIFNFCLEGLKMFREQGAIPPQAVIDATAEYQLKSDKIGNFFSECMEKCPDSNVKLVDVYSTFKNWCTLNRYGVENKGNFIAEIKGKNLLSIRGTVNGKTASNVIKGYRIIGEHNPDCSDKPKYSSVPDSSDEIF